MSKVEPNVTIGIAAYNCEKTIANALNSALAQTYTNINIWIINDCSTDSTEEILNHYKKIDGRINYKNNNENVGVGVTREIIRQSCKTNYLTWLDSDDEYFTDRIIHLVRESERSKTDIIIDSYEHFNSQGIIGKIIPNKNLKEDQYFTRLIERNGMPPHPMVSKNVYQNIRYGEYRYSEDYDYWVKSTLNGATFKHIDNLGYRYRENPTGLSKNHKASLKSTCSILNKYKLSLIEDTYQKRGFSETVINYALTVISCLSERWAEAKIYSMRAWSIENTNLQLFYGSVIDFHLNDIKTALVKLEKLENKNISEPSILNNKGVILRLLGRGEDAKKLFTEAIELFPEYQDAKINLATESFIFTNTTLRMEYAASPT